jgi:hypothetical protein
VGPRHRTHGGHRDSTVDRVHAVAGSQPLVATSARARERTYE